MWEHDRVRYTDRLSMDQHARTAAAVTEPGAGTTTAPPSVRGLGSRTAAWRATGDSYLSEIVTDPALSLLTTALRWSTLALGGVLVAIGAAPRGPGTVAAALLLVANALFRSVRPVHLADRPVAVAEVAVDLAVPLVAVAISGATASAFILTPAAPLVLAGLGAGYLAAFATTVLIGVGVEAAELLAGTADERTRSSALLALVFVTIAAACGFARGLSVDARERQARLRSELRRLTEVNELLRALQDRTRVLADSLDLGDVLASARRHLRRTVEFASLTVLIAGDVAGEWRVELSEGTRTRSSFRTAALPEPARTAIVTTRVVYAASQLEPEAEGFSPSSRSGLYLPLRARDRVVGLIALEDPEREAFSDEDVDALYALAVPLALAVDNALVFGQLRTLAAEAERARIARELHDHLAQSLAYVAFELERLAAGRSDPQLDRLREVVRDLVGELREALFGLRTTVTEDQALPDVIRDFVTHWRRRTGIDVGLYLDADPRRLPLPVEQEIWRICQEALTNVERHAEASRCAVTWTQRGRGGRLEVWDDGRGFRPDTAAHERFGLVGMRERAEAIGAVLHVQSEPGRGTCVSVSVEVPE